MKPTEKPEDAASAQTAETVEEAREEAGIPNILDIEDVLQIQILPELQVFDETVRELIEGAIRDVNDLMDRDLGGDEEQANAPENGNDHNVAEQQSEDAADQDKEKAEAVGDDERQQ